MVDLSASMPKRLRQNLMIARNRQPLEDVILAVLQRVCGGGDSHIARRTLKARQQSYLVFCETIPLAASHFFRGDLRQLIGACFPNQNGNLVVCWLSPFVCHERPN